MMKQETEKVAQEYEKKDGCNHHWIIDSAGGPTSKAYCKLCGAKREFFNSFPNPTELKKNGNVLDLPELPPVDVDEQQNKS